MKDGFCITYIKDDVMYPVGITEEQNKVIQAIVPSMCIKNPGDKVKVFTDKPIGEVVNHGSVKG